MKILVTGSSGFVGSMVLRHLEERHEVTGVDLVPAVGSGRYLCDLSDPEAVARLARQVAPELIVHAAGNKDIGFCQSHPEDAFRINGDTIGNVARTFAGRSRVLYISTDYVFAGERGGYREGDLPDSPIVYGKSKYQGELELTGIDRVVTFRMSALYDLTASFPRFLLERLSRGEAVDCFSDVHYSPTYYGDFLRALDRVIAVPELPERLFHVCGERTTRFGFASTLARVFGFDERLVRETSSHAVPVSGNAGYLFPDLSLDNRRMREVLGLQPTSIADALGELHGEWQRA
jgi:dTDP-4-dehydrorhamnose reductase